MKILLASFCYYPDPVGGSEVFVTALAKQYISKGHEAHVTAPGDQDTFYLHEGIPVHRYMFPKQMNDVSEVYDEGNESSALAFGKILDRVRPEIVHLRVFSAGPLVATHPRNKEEGIPVIFTYHTPGISCQRGTMMRWGRNACDGKLRLKTCSQCALHGNKLGRLLSFVIGSLPVSIGKHVSRWKLKWKISTLLRTTSLVQKRHEVFMNVLSEVDHIIAMSDWVVDLLLINGVDRGKSQCRVINFV